MKLKRIAVKNLRCIENCEIHIRGFTSLIGPNNCGKSSVLRAIDLLLNQSSPAVEEWRNGHGDKEIEITGEFDELQEWERTADGVAGHIYNNKIQLRVRMRIKDDGKIEKIYETFKQEEKIEGYSESWKELSEPIKTVAKELDIDSAAKWKPAKARDAVKMRLREVRKDLVTGGEAVWTDESISIPQALQQAIPQAQIIPAVRDASDDGLPGAKTSFGLLLSRVIIPAVQTSDEYKNFLTAVENLQKKLGAEDAAQIEEIGKITKQLTARLSSVIEAKVHLTVETPDAEKFIGANTGLALNDGTKTSIGLQGNGLQRALVFALLEVLATQKAQIKDEEGKLTRTRSTIILFEEPELFLHPHIMRRLKSALQLISQKPDWQVVVTTHSPFLIEVGEDPQSLVVFKRELVAPPKVEQLKEDPFGADDESQRDRAALRAVLNFHPSVCEAFFAQRTVLVEGESEIAVLSHTQSILLALAEVSPEKRAQCTVVSCGGKWTIPPIAYLLEKFKIPFRIIHDRDKKGRSDAELANIGPIDPYSANARIAKFAEPANLFVVDDTLEDLLWPVRPNSSGDKPYRAWRQTRALCENPPLPEKLKSLVQFAFNW